MKFDTTYRNNEDGSKTFVPQSKMVPYASFTQWKTDSEVFRSFLQIAKAWENLEKIRKGNGQKKLNYMYGAILLAINLKLKRSEALKQQFSAVLIQSWLKNALNLHEELCNIQSYMNKLCQIGLFDKVRKSRQRVVYKFRSVCNR